MSIIVESNSIERLFRRIPASNVDDDKPLFGFLIGYELSDLTHVVHLVRCSNKFSATYTTDENGEVETLGAPNAMSILDDESVLLHARQILRMLPGGSDIVGLFVSGSKRSLLENQAYLTKLSRKILRLRNVLSTTNFPKQIIPCQKRFLILNRDNASQKSTINIIDTNLLAEGIRSAMMSATSFAERSCQYVTVECTVSLDVKFCFPKNEKINDNSLNMKSQDFENQCHEALRPFFDRLDRSTITFNGISRDDYETCDVSSVIIAEILLPENSYNLVSACAKEICTSKLQMKGNIICRLQLPVKFTYGEAIIALKQDLIRSLKARIQLHAEGANVIEGEELAIEAFHRLPRRVFLNLTAAQEQRQQKTSKNNVKTSLANRNISILLVCDYLFESETVEDGAKNFAEVFDLDSEGINLQILTDQIIDNVELIPDECKLLQGDALDFSSRETSIDRPYRTNSLTGGVTSSSMESVEQLIKIENRLHLNNYTFLYGLLALLVALVAILIYLMLN